MRTRQLAALEMRRYEELSLNASGATHAFVYDGWLLGTRRGPTKRLRCVNPFFESRLPLEEKVARCVALYDALELPTIFRLLPFSLPATLDEHLERASWRVVEPTLMLRAPLEAIASGAPARHRVEIHEAEEWVRVTAKLLHVAPEQVSASVERARSYPYEQAGAIVTADGAIVGCGLVRIEDRKAGLFAVNTVPPLRGRGLGHAVVRALLEFARAGGADEAYLQVTASNAAALALYARFGFVKAYEYWYRIRDGQLP